MDKRRVSQAAIAVALVLSLGISHAWAVTVTVKVTGSSGTGVQGVVIAYGSGSNPSAGYFGPAPHQTDATGEITADLVEGAYSFEARYHNGKAQVLDLVIGGAPVTVPFETCQLTLRLEECDTGNPIDGGRPRYGAGDVYTTTWFPENPGLATGSSTPGQVVGELFPGDYSFEMQHAGGAEVKSFTMPAEDASLTWRASNVTLQYSGRISYGGSEGNSQWFKPDPLPVVASKYLLPDVYTIHARTDGQADLTGLFDLRVSGCSVTKSIVILKLVDQYGDPLGGGKAKECQCWFAGRRVPGETDSEYGALVDIQNGLKTDLCYEMSFGCGCEKKTQDVSVDSIFVYQTQPAALRLQKCDGTPLDGGTARYGPVPFLFWVAAWPGGATGSDGAGETTAELLPGTYSFQMEYQRTCQVKTNIALPAGSPVIWNTTAVTTTWPGALSYGGLLGNAHTFVKPVMELLPGPVKFYFRGTGGARKTVTIPETCTGFVVTR